MPSCLHEGKRTRLFHKKIYYGWYIAATAFGAYFLSTGTGFYAFNAFLEPICRLRGWTRTDLNLALVIGTVFGFSSQYIYGTLLMKIGVRPLMLAGSLTAGISFIFIVRVQTLWEFYLFYALLFMGNGAYGGIVAGSAVNNWFVDKRGKAVGLATAGMSLSGALLPLAALFLIEHTGIETAALSIGVIMSAFGPLAWLVMRDWPEDMGLVPDGFPADSPAYAAGQIHVPPVTTPPDQWPLKKLVRTDAFWKLGLAFGLLMIGTVGVMSQLKPRFSDLGFSSTTAMMMMAGASLFGAAGKYIWGMLCDRFPPGRVAIAMTLINSLGLGLGLIKQSAPALMMFIPVFGFSMGGVMSTFPIIVAARFGRKNFSGVLRYISFFLILQMFGYLIAGRSYDLTGSYDAAYTIFLGLDLAAVILLLSFKTHF